MANTKTVSFSATDETIDKLDKLTADTNLSQSRVIRAAIYLLFYSEDTEFYSELKGLGNGPEYY